EPPSPPRVFRSPASPQAAVSRGRARILLHRRRGARHNDARSQATGTTGSIWMALQSQLFRGDPKLEAAAVSDPAHILPGARGPPVAKTQGALNALEDAGLDEDGAYGPATAAAVLAYKRQRDIVNRSYQTQADNIVGKMTIAAMDKEMLQWEQERTLVKTT